MKVRKENRALVDAMSFPSLWCSASHDVYLFLNETCGINLDDPQGSVIPFNRAHAWRPYYGAVTLENGK